MVKRIPFYEALILASAIKIFVTGFDNGMISIMIIGLCGMLVDRCLGVWISGEEERKQNYNFERSLDLLRVNQDKIEEKTNQLLKVLSDDLQRLDLKQVELEEAQSKVFKAADEADKIIKAMNLRDAMRPR